YHCDCKSCTKHYADKSEAEIISSRITWELKKFDHLQRRINQTERNYHRSLKALQELEALQTPPEPAQPADPKPTSTKLASFPEKHFPESQPQPGPTEAPVKATPSDSPTNLASFPQNHFLRDLRGSSVLSVKNTDPQTLETPEATPHPATSPHPV